ncbi:MAG: hypothetical protein NZ108_02195, partial [Bacteroidia bacterium]|nr:hypothetical protein [Bacteroidia bacterium]
MIKKSLLSFLAVIGLTLSYASAQTEGGPDAWGYKWKTDGAIGGPTYNWIDITNTGTQVIGLGDDNFVGPISIPSFKFYWQDVTTMYIGSNGFITFGAGANIASGSNGFQGFPTAGAPHNVIAPFLSDLTFVDSAGASIPGAAVYHQTIGTQTIISFQNVPFWTDENPQHYRGLNTFQIILDRADSSITFQYQQSIGDCDSSYLTPGSSGLPVWLSRGMENPNSGIGIELPQNTRPTANSAVKFYYPSPDSITYQIKDIAVNDALNAESGAEFFSRGGGQPPIRAIIKNNGTQDITANFRLIASIFPQGTPGNAIYRDTLVISSLLVGQTIDTVFNRLFNDNVNPGNYTLRVQLGAFPGIPLSQVDQFTANNRVDVKLVVVDTTSTSSIILKYDDGNWNNQSEGIAGLESGMLFFPPFYPATVTKTEFQLICLRTNKRNGFRTRVLKNDGPGGAPGTLVADIIVPPDSVPFASPQGAILVNKVVNLPTATQLNPGEGLYVSYNYILVDSIYNALTNDLSLPVSNRSFEITGGLWAPYRDRATTDFSIRIHLNSLLTSNEDFIENQFTVGQSYPNPTATAAMIPFTIP